MFGSHVVTGVSEMVNLIGTQEAISFFREQGMQSHFECASFVYYTEQESKTYVDFCI
jgi:hypothetical protein